MEALSSEYGVCNHRRTTPAPDTTPAPALVARLFMFFVTAVTSEGRLQASGFPGMCQAPARSSFPVPTSVPFSRGRIQKLLSTRPGEALSRFGVVSAVTDWLGLYALLSLSFSRGTLFRCSPERSHFRLVDVAIARLPTPAHVPRTCRALHPFGRCGFGPESRGRICSGFTAHLL